LKWNCHETQSIDPEDRVVVQPAGCLSPRSRHPANLRRLPQSPARRPLSSPAAAPKTKGSQFAADALANGALAIVSEDPVSVPPHIPFLQVKNANLACALLAHEIAGNPTASMKMLAVTGTKGKTTVAYLLRSVLQAAGKKVGMIGTVEIDDGKTTVPADMTTPGSVDLVDLFSRMKKNAVEYCIMEVSSHALHQHRVAGIDFAVAIFTNLTGDHLDYHKTMEDYAAAKALLFDGLHPAAAAVINADDKWVQRIIQGCRAKIVGYQMRGEPESPLAEWFGRIDNLSSAECS